MKSAVAVALISYGIAAVISMLVALLIKGLDWCIRRPRKTDG